MGVGAQIDCAVFGAVPITDMVEREPGYLLGRIEILGVPHHVELIQVADDDMGIQVGLDFDESGSTYEGENFARLGELAEYAGGRFQTVRLDDRDFVAIVYPFLA